MTFFSHPTLRLMLFAVFSAGAGAAIRPFTIDTVLEDLRSSHPEASRVDDALPPGVVAHEEVIYSRPEGRELGLDLYRPAAAGPLPAVLIVHGGGWLSGDRRMERAFAKQLAARGYVAVPVSYRLGTPGRFPAPIFDLKTAVRWLRAHAPEYGIDPRKIAIIGGSAGGTLATFVGATNGLGEFDGPRLGSGESSAVQAVVDIDGSVSFLDNRLIAAAENEPSPYWEYVHGVYSQNRATWVAASPIIYTSRQSAPVLFIKSTAPAPVLAARDEMSARLRILGVDSAVVQLPHTPHPFWLVHPWFEQTLDYTDHFLRQQLGIGPKAG